MDRPITLKKVMTRDNWTGRRADIACLLVGVCLTFAVSLRLSAGRLLWEDEMLGWVMLRDPSWKHMVYSWLHGADGGGAFFYLTGRLWFMSFGDSNLSFRCYSATLFALAFVLVWTLVRRFYSTAVSVMALLTGWFLIPSLVPHVAEGRFYGLFVAATGGCALWVASCIESQRSSKQTYLATFLLFSVLVTSHILGICYCGALLLAWYVGDSFKGRRRWLLYLTAAASCLWLLPSLPAIQASAAVGKPHFWTTQPTVMTFLLAYVGTSGRAALLMACLLGALALTLIFFREKRPAVAQGVLQRATILTLAGSLYLIPLVFFFEGFVGPPLFDKRYLQPVLVGTVILLAELLTQMNALWTAGRRLHPAAAGIVCASTLAMVVHYDLGYLPNFIRQQKDYPARLTAKVPPRVPVICEDAFTFTELMRNHSAGEVRYLFLLDWDNAVSDTAPLLEVTQFHLMQNWRDVGYFADHIFYRNEFLADHEFFLVLHVEEEPGLKRQKAGKSRERAKEIGNPLTERFAADPAYRVLPLVSATDGPMMQVGALVCRRRLPCDVIRDQLTSRVATMPMAMSTAQVEGTAQGRIVSAR